LYRHVNRDLHPLASFPEFPFLILREILPLFELLKYILGIRAPLGRAIPSCLFGSNSIANFFYSWHRASHPLSVTALVSQDALLPATLSSTARHVVRGILDLSCLKFDADDRLLLPGA
jgi:hypothetical protein